jgi:hypothetical protein|tara:strand:+ start:292 stop:573 length:282 start_codon:yes stop_codon:yes gene_type:complete
MPDTRELDQIQQELNELQSRSNSNKQNITSHEAVCQERYDHIVKTLDILHDKINKLETLATQGKSSISTLWYVGTAVGALAAFIYTITQIFPR